MEYNEDIGKVVVGIFLALIAVFVFVFHSYLQKEQAIPLEVRVATAYCDNLKPIGDNERAECEDGVLTDIVNKFETLELCKQKMESAPTLWSRGDWSDCYDQRAADLSAAKQ